MSCVFQPNITSQDPKFQWKLHCLFCGEELENKNSHPERRPTHKVELLSPYSIQVMCQWTSEVEI